MNRNLDGVYLRIMRDGKWENVCFSDLAEYEMNAVLADKNIEWLRGLCKLLGKALKSVGDEFGIRGG